MYEIYPRFGIQVFGDTIGELWIDLVMAVVNDGNSFRENKC